MAEVAIIGAGMGGLSAAIRLAAQGRKVAVYEAASEAGGKVGRVRIDGVDADTGPSVLTMPDVLSELFVAAGSTLEEELTLVTPDQVFEYRWPDGARLPVYFHVEQTLTSVEEVFGPGARSQLSNFLRYAQRIWDEAAPAFVFGDAPTFGTAVGLGLRSLAAVRAIDPMRSMIGGIDRHVDEPHLRDLLARYATYNGSDPWQAPATLNCIAHVELRLGCYGIEGGMYQLAVAMERVARRLGVEFHYDEPVTEIESDGGEVTGIRTPARRVDVRQVVANADVSHVFGELLRHDVEQPTPSMSGWTAIVRARRRERPSHGVLFPGDYRAEFVDIFQKSRYPDEPTVYVCAQEKAHQRDGWDTHEPLFVMANAPPLSSLRSTDFAPLRRRVLERLRQVEWIVDGDEIVWERTPAGLAEQFPGSDGAIYGAASNSRFAAFQRPANRVPDIRGLYLASGSAHPGGGVPLCILSGKAAARAVLADR
jgi:phytoene desaturase